jgi:hypothetical protein
MPRNPRRSTSMGLNSILIQDGPGSPSQVFNQSSRPSLPTSSADRQSSMTISGLPTSLRETAPLMMSPGGGSHRSEGYFPPILAASAFPQPLQSMAPSTEASLSGDATMPSPTDTFTQVGLPTPAVSLPTESSTTAVQPPIPSNVTVPPPSSTSANAQVDKPAPLKLSPVDETPTQTRLSTSNIPGAVPAPIRTSHYRSSSRSTLSPTSRDTPLFAPSSVGRPASVASSHSTHSRGIPIGGPGGKSSPAMAITSSEGSGTGRFSPGSHGMTIGRPPSGSSFTASSSRMESGSGGSALGISTGLKGSPLGIASASNSSGLGVGLGTGGGSGSGFGGMARTISRGFSVGKTRTTSENSAGSGAGKAQTAAEILKQYGEKK